MSNLISSTKKVLSRFLGKGLSETVRKNRKLLIVLGIAFITITAVAFIANQSGGNAINTTIEEQTEPHRKILKEESQVERSKLEWMGFYLKNNITYSLLVIGLGVFLGIFPIYALLINASIIGYSGSEFVAKNSGLTMASLLFPHGVFELTAFVISIACGVKLGFGVARTLLNLDYLPFLKEGKEVISLIPAIIILLLVAGFVEGFISPYVGGVLDPIKIVLSLLAFGLVLSWLSGWKPKIDIK